MIKGQLIWQFDTENVVLSDVHCKTHLSNWGRNREGLLSQTAAATAAPEARRGHAPLKSALLIGTRGARG